MEPSQYGRALDAGYVQEVRDFLEAAARDRQSLSTAELGREGVHVIYAAYQSAEEGR